MKDFCQFLETRPCDPRLCCVAGTNFAAVGADRALCRMCPLADLGDVPLCEHADVYTALCKDETGEPLIQVKVWCALDDSVTENETLCAQCPARREVEVEQAVGQAAPLLVPVLTQTTLSQPRAHEWAVPYRHD